jgi:hypothetical protein
MALNIWEDSYQAFGDLRSSQFHFVEYQAAEKVQICSATTAIACGILQNNPNSGDTAVVMHEGVSKLKAGEAITFGNLIGPNAKGAGAPRTAGSDTTLYICGDARVTFVSGDIREVNLRGTPVRAA